MSHVAVVGAGIFGVTAVLALRRRGHEVSLFDPGPLPHPLAESTDISKVVRLDYGPDAHYPDQDASGRALDRFVPSAALPRPIVVDAGDGLECYWPLTEAVPVGRWRRTARRLKAACMRHDLAAQHRTTTDPYALWRVPGTHNKALTPPFLAQVIDWGDGGDSRPSLEAAPRNIRHPRR